RLPKPFGALIAITLVGTIGFAELREAQARGVFVSWRSLRRFVDVGAYARTQLPANAIYLTRLYSGSLRYYADRPTLRWDFLDGHWLDRTVAYLRDHGFTPLIVIEDGEEAGEFPARFHDSSCGALDWRPRAEYRSVQTVRIFDPAD